MRIKRYHPCSSTFLTSDDGSTRKKWCVTDTLSTFFCVCIKIGHIKEYIEWQGQYIQVHQVKQLCTFADTISDTFYTRLPWSAFSVPMVTVRSTFIISFFGILSVNRANLHAMVQVTFIFNYLKNISTRLMAFFLKMTMPNPSLQNGADSIIETRPKWKVQWFLLCWWEHNWSAWRVSVKRWGGCPSHWGSSIHSRCWQFYQKVFNDCSMGDTQQGWTTTKQKLDICFSNLNSFIKTIRYWYDNFPSIKWNGTDKIPFQHNSSKIKPMPDSKKICVFGWDK